MQAVDVRVQPGSFEVMEGGKVVARGQGAGGESCAFEADTGNEHLYVFRRHGFDDLCVKLVWDADMRRWRIVDATGSVADYLQPGQIFKLAKTVRLNTYPRDVMAAIEVLPSQTHTRVTTIYGREHFWLDLPQTSDGRVTIRDAVDYHMILVSHPGFADYPLVIETNQLVGEGGEFPSQAVVLSPLYGPFSYWKFNLVAGTAVLSSVGGYFWFIRPRRLARRRDEERQLSLAAVISEQALASVNQSEANMLGTSLVSEGGESFVLLREIGRGAMGAVFEACGDGHARGSEERWAIKMLFGDSSNPENLARFQREVKICSSLQHPGIVKVLDSGLHERKAGEPPSPFIVMELVSGSTLRQRLDANGGSLSCADAVNCTRELLVALRSAHRAGVIHRDLKPDNVMITSIGRIKIMDFGVSRVCDAEMSLTQTGMALGTPRYMSPEHIQAKTVTSASDIFSLGVMFYEMLSGQLPYDSNDVWALISMIMSSDPVPLSSLRPDLPLPLCEVVARMMARDPECRYRDADEVLAALEAISL